MARRKKQRAGMIEILGAGFLRESYAVAKTAKRELIEATDLMSGPKKKTGSRYR